MPKPLKRGNVYVFNLRIPADLIKVYEGKSHIKFSLKTRVRSEAEKLTAQHYLRCRAEFDRLRAARQSAEPLELTDALADSIVRALVPHCLEADEELRAEGMNKDAFAHHLRRQAEDMAQARHDYARGEGDSVLPQIEDWFNHYNIKLEPDSDAFKRFRRAFQVERLKAVEGIDARNRGQLVETPAPSPMALTSGRKTLNDALKEWAKSGVRPASVRLYAATVRGFVKLNGDVAIAGITKAHCQRYIDDRREAGKASNTLVREARSLSALFETAVRREWMAHNPARHLDLPRRSIPHGDKHFELSELRAIFASPRFINVKFSRPSFYWMPLLALFSGARRGELAQLKTEDILRSDHVDYIRIHGDGEDQQVKTRASVRNVPIHPELKKLGFMEYVEDMKGQNHKWLFPDLSARGSGSKRGEPVGRWFTRHLQSLGIKQEGRSFHNFRHTFIVTAHACGVGELTRRLSGHASHRNDVHDVNYLRSTYPLEPLAAAIANVCYEGLDLSPLYSGSSFIDR